MINLCNVIRENLWVNKGKLLLIINLILILFVLGSGVKADDTFVSINKVLTGMSTSTQYPASYLVDDNSDTHWGFKQGADQAWAELRLNSKSLIHGLKIDGYLAAGSELRIEYYQEGVWLPFLAPTVNNLSSSLFIDLSYDRIVTDRIRLFVSGNNLSNSYLAELKILGIPAQEYYHKIKLKEITAAENTDPVYQAGFLNDGNTYTSWKTGKENKDWQDRKFDEALEEIEELQGDKQENSSNQENQAEVVFDLKTDYQIENIKLYFTHQVKGQIELQAAQNGDWQSVDSIPNPENIGPGWFRLNLQNLVITDKIRLIVTGYGGELGGISEVEFWGKGDYSGEEIRVVGVQQPRELEETINSQFELEKEELKEYNLELAVKEETSQPLTVELNGGRLELEPSFTIRGYTIYKKELAAEYFWPGKNYLKVQPENNLTLVNSRLSEKKRTNYDLKLGDGFLFGPGRAEEEITVALNKEEYKLPDFPLLPDPPELPVKGSLKIEDWSMPTVIAQDACYDKLTVITELKIDTSAGDRIIRAKDFQLGSNASISITGPGKVHLYIENELNISSGSRINGGGEENLLELYHTGDKITIQGGIGGQDKYKFAGNIHTTAAEIFIQNGASFKGKLYARNGNITIRGGITASELIYAKTGNISITGGAQVEGQIISGGNKIEIYGGSSFDGSSASTAILAPETDISIDNGATIKGNIIANPEKVDIGHINHQQSFYRIQETRNLEKKYIEEVKIYSTRENPYLKLYALVDNNWVEFYPAAEGLKSVTFKEYQKTDKLLIKNPEGLPVTEVVVKYSTVDNQEPEIKILKPEDSQPFTNQELSREKIIGYVDNPDTEITINGQQAHHRGHYFWLEANRIGAGSNKANQINAVAKDTTGRINYDSRTIYVGQHPLLTVDLSEETIYTEENSLTINGMIRNPLNQLVINGEEVNISGSNFSKNVELNPGLNLIKIEGSKADWQGKKEFSRTIYRRVVQLTPISLTVDSPLDGYYTSQNKIVVSGMVDGSGQLIVKVNDQEAILDGAIFRSQPVDLEEGSNLIKIEASNGIENIEKEITVTRDSTAPVLSDISPEEGYISSNSLLPITGQVNDNSPVQVYVNGIISIISGDVFNNQLSFKDGQYQITVRAVDMAGNEANHQINVIVDTTPPEPFEVSADPADWTNNTSPVISFNTTDQTSGLSHYELKINDGEYIEVESPYQLPAQEDGEHTITVKAVDNAGWETISSTEVYIDTVPPEIPGNFRAISGPDRAHIKWERTEEEDVIAYRIYRQPFWNEGEYITLGIEDPLLGLEDEYHYIDNELTTGEEYTYWLEAVDHAGNIGDKTEDSTIKIGITKKPVDPDTEEEIEVEYQDVEIKVPAGAIPEEGTIEITSLDEEESPVQGTDNIVASETVNLDFRNNQGEVLGDITFKKSLTVTMSYNEELIPEGYTPFDLYIYYYSEEEGNWIRLKRAGIDYDTNRVSAEIDHFSIYNVQVSKNYSPAVQDYDDQGLSPYQSYFKNNQEYVSPASGGLTVTGIDITLPGRNGLDLTIKRIYDSNTIVMEKLKKEFDSEAKIKGYNSFGEVWNINLPWIEANDDGTFVHFEDGSASKIKWKKGGSDVRKGYFHEGRHFYVEKKQFKFDTIFSILDEGIGAYWHNDWYKVIMKDGKEYRFNKDGKITKIIDRTGQNQITFSYNGKNISHIEDSTGRRVSFDYTGNKISRIIAPGNRVYRYHYDGEKLTEVIDPAGRKTEFQYTSLEVLSGSKVTGDDKDSSNMHRVDISLIEELSYPTGGISKYEYSLHGITYYGTEVKSLASIYNWYVYNKTTIVVDTHYQILNEEDTQEITPEEYTYRFNHEYEDDKKRLSSTRQVDQQDPFRITKVTAAETAKKAIIDINEDNQIIEKMIKDNNNQELEKYFYQYDRDTKAVTLERVYKGGSDYSSYDKIYDYDNWGNVVYSEDTGTGLVTSSFYYNAESFREEFRSQPFNQGDINSHIHNLLGGKRVYNSNERDELTAVQESAYQYDSKGNLLTKAVYHQDPETGNSHWIETTYSYDTYGNITEILGPLGNRTEMSYSSEYKHAYPTLIRKTGQNNYVTDADGNITGDSIKKYGYNLNTGLKTWEIDPLGNLTEYKYDDLKRLIKITYPDEDDLTEEELKNIRIASLEPSYYSIRSNNPVKIQYYDDDNRITTVVNAEEDIDIDDYRVRGKTIEAPVINKSKYYYDTLNRWITLEQYLKGQELPITTRFFYDERSNRYKTIDAEGKETIKEYDPMNRIDKITYHDGSNTKIEYNDRENSRTITDPEGNKTKEVKDWGGNVTAVYKYNNGEEYSSHAGYDDVGNKIYEIDGNGRRTDFYYDNLNQLIEKKLPADEYVLPGDSMPTPEYRPVITYKYDDNGNKVAEITVRGNTGTTNPADYTISYHYDELNRQINIINPAGNQTKTYYNPAGQKIKVVDPLGNENKIVYNSRGNEIAVVDGEGNISYREYDIIGKKTAEYDPRGVIPLDDNPQGITGTSETILDKEYILDETYKTSYSYDSLSRQIKITDPLGNTTIVEYDKVGNKKKVINGEQSISYYYTDLYFVEKEIVNEGKESERITSYTYDKVGNRLTTTDPRGKITTSEYDDLYRLIKVIRPDNSTLEYEYDRVGNKAREIEIPEPGRRNITRYFYNSYDQIKEVIEPGITASTKYYYDPESNLIRKEMANGLKTDYEYNNLGQMTRETKPGHEITTFNYDEAGNLKTTINPLGVKITNLYDSNNRLESVEYYQVDDSGNYATIPGETISYTYDRAGNRITTIKEAAEINPDTGEKDNITGSSINFSYDPLNRITVETREIEDKSYTTSYQYDRYGNLRGIKYPGSSEYLEYNYDDLNQLKSITDIAGDIDNPAFDYYSNGSLEEISYDNGVITSYTIDDNGRADAINVTRTDIETNIEEKILSLNYDYDGAGNITRRNDNTYQYDSLNRLTKAHIEGTFYSEKGNDTGYAVKDYTGDKGIDITIDEYENITLDYASGSIGVDLGLIVDGISKIELNNIGQFDHRLKEETIDILISGDNQNYSKASRGNWTFEKDYKGDITLQLNIPVTARYIKVHCKYDDWDVELNDENEIVSVNKGEFTNLLKDIVKVYKRSTEAEIIYSYDDVGNRTRKITGEEITDYSYYYGTNRLMADETYGYVYDEAGNLIRKGNRYSKGNNTVTFTATEGEGVEYYEYEYNLQNRLSKVTKNGEIAAEFSYDADGMRIKAVEQLEEKQTNRTTYYVYGYSGKVLMEESSNTSSADISYSSYVYAFGKTFAKVDGILDPAYITTTEISYFHYDNLGSTRLMTDSTGAILMDQDYLPFGGNLPEINQVEVYNEIGMGYKYTGQNEVVSIGLYYYGARYYDPSIGRFITEDSYPGELSKPQTQNLYVYVMNNPLKYVDPTGNAAAEGHGGGNPTPPEESSPDDIIDPNRNNTDLEVPDIDIPALDYSGPYNDKVRKELEKICPPDVLEFVDIASKILDKEEFNAFVNNIFDRENSINIDIKAIAEPFYSKNGIGLLDLKFHGNKIIPGIKLVGADLGIDSKSIKAKGFLYNPNISIKIREDSLAEYYIDVEAYVGPALEFGPKKIGISKYWGFGIGFHEEHKVHLLPAPIPTL